MIWLQFIILAAGDALILKRCGISKVSKTSGICRPTIYLSIKVAKKSVPGESGYSGEIRIIS